MQRRNWRQWLRHEGSNHFSARAVCVVPADLVSMQRNPTSYLKNSNNGERYWNFSAILYITCSVLAKQPKNKTSGALSGHRHGTRELGHGPGQVPRGIELHAQSEIMKWTTYRSESCNCVAGPTVPFRIQRNERISGLASSRSIPVGRSTVSDSCENGSVAHDRVVASRTRRHSADLDVNAIFQKREVVLGSLGDRVVGRYA